MSRSTWRRGKTGTSMQIHYLKKKKTAPAKTKNKGKKRAQRKVHTLDDVMEWVKSRKPKRRKSMDESQARLMALESTATQKKKKQEKIERKKRGQKNGKK